ncbi:MAG: O-antigen polysaccharide polymerase Wzy [Propionibacteriaceae bacterium]|nr:O-antigen polysaccharide polymerase Wzy [Propionibacteriaceae bacterium]
MMFAAVALLAGMGVITVMVAQSPFSSVPVLILCLLMALPILTTAMTTNESRDLSPRHLRPGAAAALYVSAVMTVPFLYMAVTGDSIGSIQVTLITPMNAWISVLTVGMFIFGLFTMGGLTRFLGAEPGPKRVVSDSDQFLVLLGWAGRLLLLCAAGIKLLAARGSGTIFNSQYGANQLSFTSLTSLSTLGDFMIAGGAILLFSSNVRSKGNPAPLPDLLLLAVCLAPSLLLLGSRGEAIAPAIAYVWYRTLGRQRTSASIVAATLGGLLGLFVFIGRLRSGSNTPDTGFVETVVWNISSPVLINSYIIDAVPSFYEFFAGSTYVAALFGQLPGPLLRLLGYESTETGALVFREIIGLTNPDQGYGFSLPSEAFLNFGLAGVALAAFALGAAMQWAYNRAGRLGARSLLYPLLLGFLPYGFRSDALGQTKTVLYTMLILACALVLTRSIARALSWRSRARARAKTSR